MESEEKEKILESKILITGILNQDHTPEVMKALEEILRDAEAKFRQLAIDGKINNIHLQVRAKELDMDRKTYALYKILNAANK